MKTCRAGIALPVVLATLVALAGCGTSPQETVIHEACLALKAQDWEAYAELTITEADYLLRENGIDEIEADKSFAGSSLRPEQRRALREQFGRAIRGGEDSLDFSRCQFVTVTPSRQATKSTFSGQEYELEEFLLTIEMDGREFSRPGLGPYFVLARWGDEYRIIGLRWPRES